MSRQHVPNGSHRNAYRGVPRRMLMKELVTNKSSDNKTIGYFMSVIQSPSRKNISQNVYPVNRYAGLDYGDPDLAPWVILRSRFKKYEEVTFPISMCSKLLNHLLSCVRMGVEEHGTSAHMNNTETSKPIGKNPLFDLSKLSSADFEDVGLNIFLKVITEGPDSEETPSGESGVQGVRRWIQSGPLTNTVDNSTNGNSTRSLPLHTRTAHLELYETLLPNLVVFLSDICVRYKHLEQLPQVSCLYSPSGERRFFFDLRNTRYGIRLHISQVTDLHRNVIGIPLESLVDFRDRLSALVDSLNLEEEKKLCNNLSNNFSRSVRFRTYRPHSGTRQVAGSNTIKINGSEKLQQEQHNKEMKGSEESVIPPGNKQQQNPPSSPKSKLHNQNPEGNNKVEERCQSPDANGMRDQPNKVAQKPTKKRKRPSIFKPNKIPGNYQKEKNKAT